MSGEGEAMFSRDDFDRGPRFPLAGVVIPFVIGALIIAGITVGLRASQGFPDIELAEEIRQASFGEPILLADAIDLEWDRVCVFPPYLPQEAVDALLDFEWDAAPDTPAMSICCWCSSKTGRSSRTRTSSAGSWPIPILTATAERRTMPEPASWAHRSADACVDPSGPVRLRQIPGRRVSVCFVCCDSARYPAGGSNVGV